MKPPIAYPASFIIKQKSKYVATLLGKGFIWVTVAAILIGIPDVPAAWRLLSKEGMPDNLEWWAFCGFLVVWPVTFWCMVYVCIDVTVWALKRVWDAIPVFPEQAGPPKQL